MYKHPVLGEYIGVAIGILLLGGAELDASVGS